MEMRRIRALCSPEEPWHFECPNSNPKEGQGLISDLVLLALPEFQVDFIALSLNDNPNESIPHKIHEFCLRNRIHLISLIEYNTEWGKHFDYDVDRLIFTDQNSFLVNPAPEKPRNLSIISAFSPSVWALGFIVYVLTLFLLFRGNIKKIPNLAYSLSFEQRNLQKWKQFGGNAVILITFWSIASRATLILIRGRVAKIMTPWRSELDFSSMEELTRLMQERKYTHFDTAWSFCKETDPTQTWHPEFCKASERTGIRVNCTESAVEEVAKTPASFTWISSVTASHFIRNHYPHLKLFPIVQLPIRYHPVFAFPKNQSEDIAELKKVIKKSTTRLMEKGIVQKLCSDYDVVEQGLPASGKKRKISATRIDLKALKTPLLTLACGFGSALFVFLIEMFSLLRGS